MTQFCSIDYISGLKWTFLEIQKLKITIMEYLRILKRTWVHNTQGRQDKGSKIFSGGYLFGVFILACCQHINSLIAVRTALAQFSLMIHLELVVLEH